MSFSQSKAPVDTPSAGPIAGLGACQRGVTLIESLIALLVLSIALLGVGALQLATMHEEVQARWRSEAVMLAGSLIEQLRIDRQAAETLQIDANSRSGCDSVNQWLCNVVEDWQSSLAEQLPNAVVSLTIDDEGDGLLLAQLAIVWRRVRGENDDNDCRPQDDDGGGAIEGGGCLRIETAL
ncbi:type IV pilus modification PilV family protein [Salinicola rhizosphaerae]|uniref:Type IV pilus modification protein PilV n=1 Tax=Salinicola rhizosphaerae TaxID=1443141 RepID=A0ABQ3EE65_9GAMM|nr:prepilin-type N-terminal cleavage/methylation domain-containing protein [Salinicola rhizosphaerae]GHB33528.1 hypothetical protein GCM10009038_35520 [Salinicola rhizosphaerae]